MMIDRKTPAKAKPPFDTRLMMRRAVRLTLFVSAIAITAGCAAGIKGRADLPSYIEGTDSQFADDIATARAAARAAEFAYYGKAPPTPAKVSRLTTDQSIETPSQPANPIANPTLTQQLVHRDDYIYSMMLAYELALQDYARDLSIEGRGGAFAGKLAVLGLSAAGAVAPEAILSAITTGVVGVGEGYNEQLLVGNTVPVLLNNMVTEQLEVRATVFERMKDGVNAYPLSAAKLDLAALGRANTIESALARSAGTAEEKRDQAEAKADLVRTTEYNTNADGKRIQAWLNPDGKGANAARVGLIIQYMTANSLNGGAAEFISDAKTYGAEYPKFITKHGI